MKKRTLKWTLIIGTPILILLALGIYVFSIINSSFNKMSTKSTPSQFTDTTKKNEKPVKAPEPPKWEGTERINILLLGADARGTKKNSHPRSDTIMLASIDPVKKTMNLFSILRDTYATLPGRGKDKINAALAYGGVDLSLKAVAELTGLNIPYYVYAEFEGFIALIDAIDGIELDVEKNMKYTSRADKHKYDINLKKGLQILDGNTALQYVRFRHDARSDYARTERQRKLIKAITDKLQQTSTIWKIPGILDKVSDHIETNFSPIDMLKLGAVLLDVKMKASEQIPPLKLLAERNGRIEVTSDEKLKTFVQETLNKVEEDPNSKDPNSKDPNNKDPNNKDPNNKDPNSKISIEKPKDSKTKNIPNGAKTGSPKATSQQIIKTVKPQEQTNVPKQSNANSGGKKNVPGKKTQEFYDYETEEIIKKDPNEY